MSPSDDSTPSLAQSLFADFLGRTELAGPADFEALCRGHPTEAAELRRLKAARDALYGKLLAARPRTEDVPRGSLLERLQREFGSDVDPGISLSGAGASEGADAREIAERLALSTPRSGRYLLEDEIAQGGMGTVLRVWDEDLGRRLAMKLIRARRSGGPADPGAVDSRTLGRFLEEAQVTGQLDHPGIVPVHELGLDAEGRVYFTMKLVEGQTLQSVFQQVAGGEGGWSQARVLGVLLRVCEAMSYAHAKGVIHRDLKPSNVMVGRYGEVYVMDWGLARVLGKEDRRDIRLRAPQPRRAGDTGPADEPPLVTMEGDVIGTPAYMPPEQARGDVERLDQRADVYAVGAMLYQLLACRVPYVRPGERASWSAILARVLDGPPASLTELAPQAPAELVAVCERAMARDLHERYPDMSALSEDLAAFLEGRVVSAYETGAWAEARKWVRRNTPLAGSLAAGVLVLLAGLLVSSSLLFETRAQAKNLEQVAEQREREARRASQAERSAEQQRNVAERDAYLANIRMAEADLKLGKFRDLRRHLEAAPVRLRGWEWSYLDAASDTSQLTLRDSAGIRSAAFGPGGRRLALGCGEGTARIVEVESGRVGLQVTTGLPSVECIDYGANGLLLAAGGDPRSGIWDSRTGENLLYLEWLRPSSARNMLNPDGQRSGKSADSVARAVLSPDGKRAVTIYNDLSRTTLLWDVESGDQIGNLGSMSGGRAQQVALGPSGRYVAVAYHNNQAWVWDRDGGPVARIDTANPILDLAFSPDPEDALLALASEDGTVLLHEVETDRPRPPPPGHADSVHVVAFDPGGDRLLTASKDGWVRLWNVEDPTDPVELQTGVVSLARFIPSGSSRVLTASEDGTLTIWDPTEMSEPLRMAGHSGPLRSAMFDRSGTLLVTVGEDREARIWSLIHLDSPRRLDELAGEIDHAAQSTDGDRVVTATFADRQAKVWDTASGDLLRSLGGHSAPIQNVAIDPSGALAATASGRVVRVWDLDTGAALFVLEGHTDDALAMSFSTNGARLATAQRDGIVRIWNLARTPDGSSAEPPRPSRRQEATLREWRGSGAAEAVEAIALDPSGSRLVAVLSDWTACVIDVASDARLAVLRGRHRGAIHDAAFSPDGTLVATAADDGTAHLWEAATGEWRRELSGHTRPVRTIAFSGDGKRLVTASDDGKACVWKSASGELLLSLEAPGEGLACAAFRSDGSSLTAVSRDGWSCSWRAVRASERWKQSRE